MEFRHSCRTSRISSACFFWQMRSTLVLPRKHLLTLEIPTLSTISPDDLAAQRSSICKKLVDASEHRCMRFVLDVEFSRIDVACYQVLYSMIPLESHDLDPRIPKERQNCLGNCCPKCSQASTGQPPYLSIYESSNFIWLDPSILS